MSGILQLVNTFPSGGFAVKNSLRFRSSASAYLSRTFGTPTSQQLMTFSFWVKRGLLAKNNMIWNNFVSGSSYGQILFGSSDSIEIYSRSGSATTQINLIATQVFRDPSAWYHIVVAVDTTQATAANRVKLYVNGSQVTSFSTATYPSQNDNINFEISGRSTAIGVRADLGDSTQNLDGYLAEVNFIDGQALTPSSFGAFDPTSGVWQPTKYSGTYGTNGFYLKFSDTTSTTTLCYDYSGNSNNWTPNNISLTAGSTYDSMLDSPTNYDNGGNGVGNYCVLNPLYAYSSLTLSGANLNIASSANYRSGMASFGMSSGKWYWEYVVTAVGNDTVLGISSNPSVTIASYPGNDALSWGYEAQVGNKYNNGSFSAYGATYTTNDVIGIAFDADAGSLTFYKNGVSQGVAYSGLASGIYYAAFGLGTSSTGSANFGQRPFAYTPPTGYKALNTQNLPAPSIVNGASYMEATTYTGTGASLSVSGAAFQPDLVWIKSRSAATDNKLTDSVRGVTNALVSNSTAAATTDSGGVTAFNSNGFTVGTNAAYNTNAATYIGWQWKAGGTAVTNTAGSITSSVSANTTAGFSVVTFTSPSSFTNATIGHGLGATPAMIITKSRTSVGGWVVWHISLGVNGYLSLESTSASGTNSQAYNGTSSTTFTIGSNSWWQAASQNWVSYCFAAIPGYSAFGSYTGNGSADGPFVFTGMRPRWLLIKRTDSSVGASWWIHDTSRSTYNIVSNELVANDSAAEYTYQPLDIVSNGFKIRINDASWNASGGTYIYAAFAENPLKYSLAR